MVTVVGVVIEPPVTVPLVGSTDATSVLLLVQVPPLTGSPRVVVPPLAHTFMMPVMATGAGCTVITFMALQPADVV